jgi:hypothetical protein
MHTKPTWSTTSELNWLDKIGEFSDCLSGRADKRARLLRGYLEACDKGRDWKREHIEPAAVIKHAKKLLLEVEE